MKFRVVETFGPTIQGEGPNVGQRAFFVRFGGCDYRCSWCDSMHAVWPDHVRKAPQMTIEQIVKALDKLGARPRDRVVLSGGNPALWDLEHLVDSLHATHRLVDVETQGSVWRSWLGLVDTLVVSPKPPSSGMTSAVHTHQTDRFLTIAHDEISPSTKRALKIVVADRRDYEWALDLAARYPWPLYLSAMTPPGLDHDHTLAAVGRSFHQLAEWARHETSVRPLVLPQVHVVAWGPEQGR